MTSPAQDMIRRAARRNFQLTHALQQPGVLGGQRKLERRLDTLGW